MDPFILQSIEHDIPFVLETIQETAFQLLGLKVTKYPIFIFYKHNFIDLGKPFITKDIMNIDWNISISHLEDLVNKNIVQYHKVEEFRKNYKDPQSYICILVITEEESGFVYYPYPPLIEN